MAGLFENKLDKYQCKNSYASAIPCGYQVLRTAKNRNIPAILWEVAFINNKTGSDRLNDSKLMEKYTDMLTESVVEYFKGNKAASGSAAAASKPANNQKTHKVKSGETLGSIANKYKVKISDLKKWNKLKNDNIKAGQTLIVKQ